MEKNWKDTLIVRDESAPIILVVDDEEAIALIAQLSPERRREILARLRLEVELQRQAELEKERK